MGAIPPAVKGVLLHTRRKLVSSNTAFSPALCTMPCSRPTIRGQGNHRTVGALPCRKMPPIATVPGRPAKGRTPAPEVCLCRGPQIERRGNEQWNNCPAEK